MLYHCHRARLELFETTILEDVSITIKAAHYYHLKGNNGVGKTLLVQAMLGLNNALNRPEINNFRRHPITYIPDTPFFLDNDTVAHVLLTLSFFYKVSYRQVLSCFQAMNIDETNVTRKRITHLSLGTQQKLALVPLFLRDTGIFVMDEIFSGLDLPTQEQIIQRLQHLHHHGATLILIEHTHSIITKIKQTAHIKEILCTPQNTLNLD